MRTEADELRMRLMFDMDKSDYHWQWVYGHRLPEGWDNWVDYHLNHPTEERKAAQLLTGQEE